MKNILERALKQFSPEKQILKTIEEMGELTQALCKHQLYPNTLLPSDSVIDKIADVLIMVEQMRIHFGCERVDARIKQKLLRLEDRMNHWNAYRAPESVL